MTASIPCHFALFRNVPDTASEYVDAYLAAVGDVSDRDAPLFRGGRGAGAARPAALGRLHALRMVKRRAKAAGLSTDISPHSFRATSITDYLRGAGDRDTSARIAGHESTRSTRPYVRRDVIWPSANPLTRSFAPLTIRQAAQVVMDSGRVQE